MDVIQYGERVLLCQAVDRSYIVKLEAGGRFSSHLGIFEHDRIVGMQPGQWIYSHRNKPMLLLRPTTADLMMKVRRQTNIIYPKDAAQLIMRCGIVPGSRVLEVGTGSGSLTTALALTVGATGKIYTYDIRQDMSDRGRKNVAAAGLSDRVEFGLRSTGEPFAQEQVDVVILDVPTPWMEIEPLTKVLKLGGRLASLNPTYNQIEQFATALENAEFGFVEAEEILWRRILARSGRTRPEQRMVGHTEFLLYAVRAERPAVPVEVEQEETPSTELHEVTAEEVAATEGMDDALDAPAAQTPASEAPTSQDSAPEAAPEPAQQPAAESASTSAAETLQPVPEASAAEAQVVQAALESAPPETAPAEAAPAAEAATPDAAPQPSLAEGAPELSVEAKPTEEPAA